MGNHPGPPEYILALNTAELVIRRALGRPDASPFVAHCEIDEAYRPRFVEGFKKFLAGDGGRIQEAFRRWPLASIWNFAIALSKEYGEDGHAVYAVLERTFGVKIAGEIRNRIIEAFRSVCRKYGLVHDGSERWVNDYLAQAGIATSQLDHVAKAFLFAERAYGLPSHESTVTLNSWEDDAAYFLPHGVRIPRMVLEVDESAHYAFLFVRYRRQETPRNQFERLFFEGIAKAQGFVAGGRRAETVPKPVLIWGQNGLALSLAKVEGRLRVTIGGESRKLRGGQNWPLPMPWPACIDWSLEDHSERISVFPTSRHVLAFDTETGRLVSLIDTNQQSHWVDAREVMFVALRPFSLEGEAAYEVGQGGYASHCVLGNEVTRLEIDSRKIELRAKPKPRIWLECGSVAKGVKGLLVLADSTFGIEAGELDTEEFDLSITVGDHQEIVPISVSSKNRIASHQLSNHVSRTRDLVAVKLELRLRGSARALVRYKAWLWPGLRALKDGLVFDSDTVPTNYSADRSRHIGEDNYGHLCLDMSAAYETATLVFQVGYDLIDFDIPKPGVSLLYTDVSGFSTPLRIGDPLIVRDEDKGGSLIIRCPEKTASLTVRGRYEPAAFERNATRILSLAELISPATRDDITVTMPGKAYAPITLVRVVPAAAPKKFSIERKGVFLTVRIEMQNDVNAIRFSLEDEIGTRSECDYEIGQRGVDHRSPPWLTAKHNSDTSRGIVASIDLRQFTGRLSLAHILVQYVGNDSFRPLRNIRGDSYAVLLKTDGTDVGDLTQAPNAPERFSTYNRWMNECYAEESWEYVGSRIQSCWMAVGGELSRQAEGLGVLLPGAHLPPQPGASKSWIPLAHPLQISVSLYGAPANSFFALSTGVSEGSEHLAVLAETAGRTIQEVHKTIGLSPAFLMAFDNFQRASRLFEKTRHAHQPVPVLRGFSFERYTQIFRSMDSNPGARWFWRLGDELLGPAHYGAAIGRLLDRLLDAGLEEEGANDARLRNATALANAAFRQKEKTLPMPTGVEGSHAILEWIPAFISGFARASRAGSPDSYLRIMGNATERPYRSLIGDASFLVRLAPELFAFYLTLWELGSEKQAA